MMTIKSVTGCALNMAVKFFKLKPKLLLSKLKHPVRILYNVESNKQLA